MVDSSARNSYLSSNQLSGTIPWTIGSLVKLVILYEHHSHPVDLHWHGLTHRLTHDFTANCTRINCQEPFHRPLDYLSISSTCTTTVARLLPSSSVAHLCVSLQSTIQLAATWTTISSQEPYHRPLDRLRICNTCTNPYIQDNLVFRCIVTCVDFRQRSLSLLIRVTPNCDISATSIG